MLGEKEVQITAMNRSSMRSVNSTALRQLRVPSWRPRHIPSKGGASHPRLSQRLARPLAQKLLMSRARLGLAVQYARAVCVAWRTYAPTSRVVSQEQLVRCGEAHEPLYSP